MKRRVKVLAVYGIGALVVLIMLIPGRLRPSRPNVIIILIDALRRDHLGCYGYHRDTSPFIDSMAEKAVLFETAITQAPGTKASVGSLFTSLYPTMHTALSHGSEGVEGDVLPSTVRTIAEILMEAGYATIGITANPHITAEFGFDQGFDTLIFRNYLPARDLTEVALSQVEGVSGKPLFLFLHYMDVHAPYDPPPPYDTLYNPREGVPYYVDGIPDREITPDELQFMIDRYDACINYTDACVRELFEQLARRGMMDNSMVILLADHGEQFLEHGGLGHGILYDEVIRVPLIMSFPAGGPATARISGHVELIDLFPTILSYARVPYRKDDICGRDLMPLIRGGRPVRTECYTERRHLDKSIRDEHYKYIFPCTPNRRELLFDLQRDPGEQRNLADSELQVAGNYRAMMEHWIGEMGKMSDRLGIAPQKVTIDERTREALKALGYIQ
ncbi:MAG: sulfatase [bacterium]|nr:sulfatase [bacterium]